MHSPKGIFNAPLGFFWVKVLHTHCTLFSSWFTIGGALCTIRYGGWSGIKFPNLRKCTGNSHLPSRKPNKNQVWPFTSRFPSSHWRWKILILHWVCGYYLVGLEILSRHIQKPVILASHLSWPLGHLPKPATLASCPMDWATIHQNQPPTSRHHRQQIFQAPPQHCPALQNLFVLQAPNFPICHTRCIINS